MLIVYSSTLRCLTLLYVLQFIHLRCLSPCSGALHCIPLLLRIIIALLTYFLLFSAVLLCSTPRWLLLSFTSLQQCFTLSHTAVVPGTYLSSLRCLIPVLAVVRTMPIFLPSLLFTSLQQCFTVSYTAARVIIALRAYLLQYLLILC